MARDCGWDHVPKCLNATNERAVCSYSCVSHKSATLRDGWLDKGWAGWMPTADEKFQGFGKGGYPREMS